MPPSGVDYASEFLNGYAPEYVPISIFSRNKFQIKYSDIMFHCTNVLNSA